MRASSPAAISAAPLPIRCNGYTSSPAVEQLQVWAADQTMVALVLVDSPDHPYPVRLQGRVSRAVGRYWTWLCGTELALALKLGHIKLCESVWRWPHLRADPHAGSALLGMVADTAAIGLPAHTAYVRSLYSALVGGWARWSRQWERVDRPSNLGPWATWVGYDPQTQELTRWRSVAGVVERRVYVMAAMIGYQHVIAVCADSLWLTADGSRRLRQIAGDQSQTNPEMACKDVYDRAWLDGHGRAVVERDGERWPVVQGIPTYARIGPDGKSHWMATSPWDECGRKHTDSTVALTGMSFDAARLIRECDHAPVPAHAWLSLDSIQMREELLTPVKRRREHSDTDLCEGK